MEPIIEVENISKHYVLRHEEQAYSTLRDSIQHFFRNFSSPNTAKKEDFWALNQVSFQVNQGDRVGIIGRNGAGKSTLLKILSRITEPTSGRVVIRGRVASLLEVGTGFHPELTGRENIFLNGSILGMSRNEIKMKFDEIVAFAEVSRFLDTPVKRYSSGMYVRLAFAVAAHLEPEILIVDEVLAVGDAEFQKKCLGKMKEVTGEGRTVLFVSHNLSAIQNLCNKVVFLKSGSVEFDGDMETGLSKYIKSAGNTLILLKDRSDRKGNGQLLFESIQFKDESNQFTPSLRCGRQGSILLQLTKRINYPLHSVKISIGIDNEFGQRVLLLSNDLTDQLFLVQDSSVSVQVSIPTIALQPGVYSFTLFAASGETVFDWVEMAGNLEVEQGDFFGTGRLAPSQGVFYTPHQFQLLRT
ncbi:MAG: ABC transporter ATP-binding protein [Cytophagaceae bacterium]|jgi:lipopolysaccharide transport system ATP-binding protein|nr:ABC transporter ATP-binding protein [Cytophagaceae bacterium]